MGSLATMPVELTAGQELLLVVRLDCLQQRSALVAISHDAAEGSLEARCLAERGVRIDGKLACDMSIELEPDDEVRISLGSEHATLRYVDRLGRPSLQVTTSTGTEVQQVDAARFDEERSAVVWTA